ALLKEFKRYCCKQWDLQAYQAKELEATTKGKEKAAEVSEESLESSDEQEQIEGKGSEDGDIEMGAAPLASAM
ncbi:hypothetical protein ID866_12437, partial [Astraeus odoratus]